MPVYEFRLDAQDGSGHFRSGRIAADTEDEARATLQMRELEYQLTALDTDELAELEKLYGALLRDDLGLDEDASGIDAVLALPKEAKMPASLPPAVRAKLALHRQQKPYKLSKLSEQKES